MKLLLSTLALPMLLFALSGDWVWRGDNRIIFDIQSAFSGSIAFAGVTLKNSVASLSLILAYILVVIGIFRIQKNLAILGLGALILPSLHSCYYLTHLYTSEFRNGPSHVAFVTVIVMVYWMSFRLLITPQHQECEQAGGDNRIQR